MRVGTWIVLAASVVGQCATGPALACGDKLAALGGGVRIERIPRSDHPGLVVVVASPSLAGSQAGAEGLVAALRRAGHDARLVSGPGELESTTRERVPDIVLADVTTTAVLRERYEPRLPAAAIVPLLYRPTRGDLDAARQTSGCVAPIADWGVAPVLRVIDRIRAQQAAGQAVTCTAGSRNRA